MLDLLSLGPPDLTSGLCARACVLLLAKEERRERKRCLSRDRTGCNAHLNGHLRAHCFAITVLNPLESDTDVVAVQFRENATISMCVRINRAHGEGREAAYLPLLEYSTANTLRLQAGIMPLL